MHQDNKADKALLALTELLILRVFIAEQKAKNQSDRLSYRKTDDGNFAKICS